MQTHPLHAHVGTRTGTSQTPASPDDWVTHSQSQQTVIYGAQSKSLHLGWQGYLFNKDSQTPCTELSHHGRYTSGPRERAQVLTAAYF